MKSIKMLVAGASLLVLGGCAGVASPVGNGLLVTTVQGPVTATTNADSSKTGQSCAVNVFGIIATGNASISAAAKNGDISEIAVVDHKSTSVLGVFSKYCTVVSGK